MGSRQESRAFFSWAGVGGATHDKSQSLPHSAGEKPPPPPAWGPVLPYPNPKMVLAPIGREEWGKRRGHREKGAPCRLLHAGFLGAPGAIHV